MEIVVHYRYLNRTYNGVPVVILGDSTYPRLPLVLTPYASTSLRSIEAKFNYVFSSQRIVIEHSFGMLKGRFRLLLKKFELATYNVEQIVVACCVLHNFSLEGKELFPEEWMVDEDELTENEIDAFTNDVAEWELDGDSTQELFLQYVQ